MGSKEKRTMKWYHWVISGIVALLIVLLFLPLIIWIEWWDIMGRIREKKQILEHPKQKLEHIKSKYEEE